MKSRNYRNQTAATNAGTMVAEMVVGAVTGVSSVRRMILQTMLMMALLVGGAAFIAGVMLSNYLPSLTDSGRINRVGQSGFLATPRATTYNSLDQRDAPYMLQPEFLKPQRPVRLIYDSGKKPRKQ